MIGEETITSLAVHRRAAGGVGPPCVSFNFIFSTSNPFYNVVFVNNYFLTLLRFEPTPFYVGV